MVREKIALQPRNAVKWSRGKITLLAMTLPSFLIVLLFSYGPIFGWMYAFFDYRIGMRMSDAAFSGLKYFRIALESPDLLRVVRNTLALSILSLLNIPIAAAMAIFLSEVGSKLFRKFVQSATTLPYFISWIIVYAIFFSFFAPDSGYINHVLMKLGWIEAPMDPLGNNDLVWFVQTFISIWKNMGYNAIIFFAAIVSIDQEQYDAASVDGAGRFRSMRHITVPGIMPTFIVLLLINIGFLLSNGFDQFYVFYNPLVSENIEVLDYYVYRVGLIQGDVPVATAISVVKTVISVLLVFGASLLSRRATGKSII